MMKTPKNGKKSIVDLLSSVDTDFDYSGNFLSRNRHERSISNFIVDKKIKQFNYGIFTTREAIDKLVRKYISKQYYFILTITNFLTYLYNRDSGPR